MTITNSCVCYCALRKAMQKLVVLSWTILFLSCISTVSAKSVTPTARVFGSCNHVRIALENDATFSSSSVPYYPTDSGDLSVCARGNSPIVATVIPGPAGQALLAGQPVLDTCCSAQLEDQFLKHAAQTLPKLIATLNEPLLERIETHERALQEAIETYLKQTEIKLIIQLATLFSGEAWSKEIKQAVPNLMLSIRNALNTIPFADVQLPYSEDGTENTIIKAFNKFFDKLTPRHFVCFLSDCQQESVDPTYWACLSGVMSEQTMFRNEITRISAETVKSIQYLRTAQHSINHIKLLLQEIATPQMWGDARSCFVEYSRMMYCSVCVPDFLTATGDIDMCTDFCHDTVNHCLNTAIGSKFGDTWKNTLEGLKEFASEAVVLEEMYYGDRSAKKIYPEATIGNLSTSLHSFFGDSMPGRMPILSKEVQSVCGNAPKDIVDPSYFAKQPKIKEKSRELRTVSKNAEKGVWEVFMDITSELQELSMWWHTIPRALCKDTDAKLCWNGTHFDSYVRSVASVGPEVVGGTVKGATDDQGIDIQTKLANLQKTLARNKADRSLTNHGLHNAQASYPDLQNPSGRGLDQFDGSGDMPDDDTYKFNHRNDDTHFWYSEDDEDGMDGSGSGMGFVDDNYPYAPNNNQFNPHSDTKLKPMLPNSNSGTGKFATSDTHPDDKSRSGALSTVHCSTVLWTVTVALVISLLMRA